MVKVTLTFDYPTADKFLESHIWQWIAERLVAHCRCVSFSIKDDKED